MQVSELFPFNYTVRKSVRAKCPQLRITMRHGLEVIIPARLINQFDIYTFLQQKRCWVEKNLPKEISIIDNSLLPSQIALRSIEEDWSVNYILNRRFELIENPLRQLTLLGDIDNISYCHKRLILWLKNKAELYLGDWLLQLSHEVGLSFRNFQIRGQQTRWGSCSVDRDISLNYQLLFLPRLLTRHILLHELVHTRYMNHGVRFGNLLKQLDENTKEHAYQVKRASSYVPKWVYRCT